PTALARLGSAMTRPPPPLFLVGAYVRSGGRREMHDAIQDGGRGPPEQGAAELRAARPWRRRAGVPVLVRRRCEATRGVLRHRRDAARSPLRVQRGGWLDVIVRSSKSVPLDQLARTCPNKGSVDDAGEVRMAYSGAATTWTQSGHLSTLADSHSISGTTMSAPDREPTRNLARLAVDGVGRPEGNKRPHPQPPP